MKPRIKSRKKTPLGIMVLSILMWTNAIYALLLGLFLMLDQFFFSIFLFCIGIFFIFVGLYLWRGRRWARTFLILYNTFFIIIYTLIIAYYLSNIKAIIGGLFLLFPASCH